QALGANFLHHALHRRVDAPDRMMVRLQEREEHAVARLLDGLHHAVRADHDEAVHRVQWDGVFAQFTASIRRHGFDDITDEGGILHASGGEARSFVAAPADEVRGLLDLLDFVAVDDLLVTGEVDDPRAFLAQLLTYRKQNSIAESSACKQHGFPRRCFAGSACWTHQDDRLPG